MGSLNRSSREVVATSQRDIESNKKMRQKRKLKLEQLLAHGVTVFYVEQEHKSVGKSGCQQPYEVSVVVCCKPQTAQNGK
jgi:hypothetical protein